MAIKNFEIDGLATLKAELAKFDDKTATRLGKRATVKGAGTLKTSLRRAGSKVPKLTFGGTKYRLAKLIKVKLLKRPIENNGVGARVTGNGVLRVWEQGRKAYLRKGYLVEGSPQMARFKFWHRTVDGNAGQAALQKTVDIALEMVEKEWAKIAKKVTAATK